MNNYITKIKPYIKRVSLIFIFSLFICIQAFAYEDCLIITNGKMTDIRIENNEIIDVFPLITIMNDKNTIIVHPLKEGNTRFSVLKNNKNTAVFNVKVKQDKTIIDEVKGYEILPIDFPPERYEFDLDFPPKIKQERGI